MEWGQRALKELQSPLQVRVCITRSTGDHMSNTWPHRVKEMACSGELQTGSMSSASHTNTSLTILNGDRIWPVIPFCSSLVHLSPPPSQRKLSNACILESVCM